VPFKQLTAVHRGTVSAMITGDRTSAATRQQTTQFRIERQLSRFAFTGSKGGRSRPGDGEMIVGPRYDKIRRVARTIADLGANA
jgi:hypothetical protein